MFLQGDFVQKLPNMKALKVTLTRFLVIQSIFAIIVGSMSYSSLKTEKDHAVQTLLCRSCGETIVSSSGIINVPSASSKKAWYDTIMGVEGVLLQQFVNPSRIQFNVITMKEANVLESKEEIMEDTWFKDHSWMFCSCSRCRSHLGWKYKPFNFNHLTHDKGEMFYGLIYDKLVEDEVSDTLLLVPDSYKI